MGRHTRRPQAPGLGRRARRRWIAAGVVVVAGLAAGVAWFWPGATPTASGTPRLAVDRTEIDFGDVPFERMVTAVFTLTNGGDGPLRIEEVSRVRVVEGC